ncbi:retroviral-like aspartic protease family protein [Dolichospermum sp. ST_sed3]|nr:retroviral-like aspartic protease family protein [Dolichospermum sp. ST_sed3]
MKEIYVLVLIVLSNFCFAQNISFNKGNTQEQNYYSEIQFEYINGKIIIPVLINEITYRFLLDTGAPNLISKQLTTILKLKSSQEIKVGDTNDNQLSMNVVELPKLTIGNIVFENSVALSSNDENNLVFDCFNLDGFIGSNLLRNSIIQIDIKNKTLILTNDETKLKLNKKKNSKISLIGIQSSPYIWIKLKGEKSGKEQVLLDTGMKGFYSISNRNYNIFKDTKIFKLIASGSGTESLGLFGNSKINTQLSLQLPKIEISNSNFINISTITTNDSNSKIGIDLFEKGTATIDFLNKKFYYEQFVNNLDLNEKFSKFSPTILNNKLSIGIVWDEKLKDIIYTGDEIIEINGKNYENYPLCDFINKKSIFENIEITKIKIKNKNGELKTITL